MKNLTPTINVVALSIMLVVACGSDAATPMSTCMAGSTSTPGSKGDPCAQQGTSCSAIGGVGISVCAASGSWGQCTCQMSAQSAASMTPGLVATPSCGNGVVDVSAGEQCEVGGPGTTCSAMLGAGASGNVMCVGCKFDFSMCSAATLNPAGGAGMGAARGGAGL
jgi:hypothetical protein